MILSDIMTSFHGYDRRWICQFDRNVDIYSFAFLEGATDFEGNILYFGDVSMLPKEPPQMNLTFVCVADQQVPDYYLNEAQGLINLILIDKGTSTIQILKILTDLFGNAARVSSGRAHLIEVLHSNRGLQYIINEAYGILQNPITVLDSSYKILAMYEDSEASGEREDLEEQRSLGFVLQKNVEAMSKAHLYEHVRTEGRPIYMKDENSKYGWVTSLIYIHGIEVGQIGVMDSRHPISDMDMQIIEFLSQVVSLELQKSDFYRTNQGLMHSYFLSDLLDNQVHDSSAIQQRMQSLGWDFINNMRIMVLTDHQQNFFDGKAHLITSQLHKLLPGSRWVVYHGQIVFLVASASHGSSAMEALYHYLEINNLTASVSNAFDNILELRKYYQQALKADYYGNKFAPEEYVHVYADYFIYHVGEIISNENNIQDFCHPAVLAIRDYDEKHGTNFIETLRLHLKYINQPGTVAQKLFIHKNTVFYRINKLKEQFDINLDDGDECLKIAMTLKFLEMM